jgi:hypothetical protein
MPLKTAEDRMSRAVGMVLALAAVALFGVGWIIYAIVKAIL